MQPGSPFQLVKTLGSCPEGKVWSAIDAQGQALTVAILDAAVASDQQWRTSFASMANALRARDGRPSFLHADFHAPAPWVAYAAGSGTEAEQVFLALGLNYRPEQAQAEPPWAKLASGEAPATPDATGATSSGGAQVSADVVEQPPPDHRPTSGAGLPGYPQHPPVSVPPASSVSGPPSAPDSAPPWNQSYSSGYPALRSTVRKPPRRTKLWVGIAAALVVVLGAVVGFVVWQPGDDDPPSPTGQDASPSATVSSSPEPIVLPSGTPRRPGIEPPQAGSWPTEPVFGDADQAKVENPAGLGFSIKVPASWSCDARQRVPGFTRYLCGVSRPGVPEVGGEVIVRNCPKPCGEEVQTAYRKAEEAWGLQWVQAGTATFAEAPEAGGRGRYGLVVVGWWRSNADGPLDREVVVRMTATEAQIGEVRKVANGIRTTLSF